MEGRIDALAIAAGVVLAVGGIALIAVGLLGFWPVTIYGVVCLVLGLIILTTLKQQEHVEQIKSKKYKNQKEVLE
ncbi:MAG: hypothetical protein KKD18_06795 [Nanoarchaeota archaeon]|nr:hypothetical protein [Nanoarchaeota archaeon]MBU0978099.1 hypothetical protein [Nanoarchaeota archaeon]